MARPATGNLLEIRSTRTGEVSSYSARVTYNGQRRSVRLKARERPLAEAEMRQIVEEISLGTWVPPPNWVKPAVPSFGGFAMEWFARRCLEGGRKRIGLAASSQAELQWALDHLLEHFASMPIDTITIADVDRYRLAKVRQAKLSANSINKTIAALAAILEQAVEYELIDRNPAKGRRRRLAATKPHRPGLDRACQITALLDAGAGLDQDAQFRPGQRRLVLATLIFAGLRLGEALALRWEDIDLTAGVIRIRDAKTPTGIRQVDLLPVLRAELSAYKARHADKRDSLLFVTRTGQALDPTNVRQRILAPAVKDAERKLRKEDLPPLPDGLTPHSLRRTFASLLFALGEPPPYVMSQMGHSSPSLTLSIYAKEMHRRDGEHAKLRALIEGRATVDEPARSTITTTGSAAAFSVPWLGHARS
jgi:integrase